MVACLFCGSSAKANTEYLHMYHSQTHLAQMRNMMSQSIKRATVGNLSALVEDYEFNDGKNP